MPPEGVYLGIHQRLDRDTSGVLLFTRRKSANAAIAAQFEGRNVKKTYRAGVVGWPPKLTEGVLSHTLASGEGGRMKIASRAQEAITRYRVLERVGERAILELAAARQAVSNVRCVRSGLALLVLHGTDQFSATRSLPDDFFDGLHVFAAGFEAERRRNELVGGSSSAQRCDLAGSSPGKSGGLPHHAAEEFGNVMREQFAQFPGHRVRRIGSQRLRRK